MFFKMLMATPLPDLEAYLKLSKAYYALLLAVAKDHTGCLAKLDPSLFTCVGGLAVPRLRLDWLALGAALGSQSPLLQLRHSHACARYQERDCGHLHPVLRHPRLHRHLCRHQVRLRACVLACLCPCSPLTADERGTSPTQRQRLLASCLRNAVTSSHRHSPALTRAGTCP